MIYTLIIRLEIELLRNYEGQCLSLKKKNYYWQKQLSNSYIPFSFRFLKECCPKRSVLNSLNMVLTLSKLEIFI